MKLSFLKVLCIVSFVHYNVFPWWIWLWAIMEEFEGYSLHALQIRFFNSFTIGTITYRDSPEETKNNN
jgi:hypothetical protein